MAEITHSSGEKLDEEVDFYVRHLIGGDLSEEAASKLKEQTEALGYTFRATIFGGGKYVLVCIPDSRRLVWLRMVFEALGFQKSKRC